MGVYRNSSLTFDTKDKYDAEDKLDMLLSTIVAKNKKDVAVLHSITDDEKGYFIHFDNSTGQADYLEGPYIPQGSDSRYNHHNLIYSFYLEHCDKDPYHTDIILSNPDGESKYVGSLNVEPNGKGGYTIELYDFDKDYKNGLADALDRYNEFIKLGLEIGNCNIHCFNEEGELNWDINVKTPPLKKNLEKEYNKLVKKLEKNPMQTVDTKLNMDKLPKTVDFEFHIVVPEIDRGSSGEMAYIAQMFGKAKKTDYTQLREAMDEVVDYIRPVLNSGKFTQPELGDMVNLNATYFSNDAKNEYVVVRNRYFYGHDENMIVIKGVANEKIANKLSDMIINIEKNKTNGKYKMEYKPVSYSLYNIYDINKPQVQALYEAKKDAYKNWMVEIVKERSEASLSNHEGRFAVKPEFDDLFELKYCIDYRDRGSIDKVKEYAKTYGSHLYKELIATNVLEQQRTLDTERNVVALVEPQKDFYLLENCNLVKKADSNEFTVGADDNCVIKTPDGKPMFSWDKFKNNIPHKKNQYYLPQTFDRKQFINENRKKLEEYQKLMEEGKTDSQKAKMIEASVLSSLVERAEQAVQQSVALDNKKNEELMKKAQSERDAVKQSGKQTFLSKAQWGLVKVGEDFVKKNDIRRKDGQLMLFERDWKDQRKALSQWMFSLQKRGFGKDREDSKNK